jgi:hypothetical protein
MLCMPAASASLSVFLCVPLWSERLNQTTEGRGIKFFQHVILNGFQPAKDLTTAEISTGVGGILGGIGDSGSPALPLALVNEANHKQPAHNSSQRSRSAFHR